MTDYSRINPSDVSDNSETRAILSNERGSGFQKPPSLRARLCCEFIGTCLFIFFGAGCVAKPDVNLLTASAAHGLVTMWLVYVFGPISGGHFNAGATVAFAINGKMKAIEIIGYLIAQCLGALLSGALLLTIYGTHSTLGTPGLSSGFPVMRGFAIEFICTTILSFVIFFTTTYHTNKEAAFPIGLTVFSSFLVGADLDGAALNPWRWLGPAVASGHFVSTAWIYTVGPLGGFVLGSILFRIYHLVCNSNHSQSYNQL